MFCTLLFRTYVLACTLTQLSVYIAEPSSSLFLCMYLSISPLLYHSVSHPTLTLLSLLHTHPHYSHTPLSFPPSFSLSLSLHLSLSLSLVSPSHCYSGLRLMLQLP